MIRLIKTATLFLALCISAQVQAQGVDDLDAERSVLHDKLTLIESALNEKAFDQILPLLDDDVVVVFLNGEVARGIDQVRTYFEKTLGSSNPILTDYVTKAEVGRPASFVGDVALADGSTEDTFVFADGSEMVVHSFWTVTLQKKAGEWKILQLHFSSNIFDNPLVESAKNNLIMFTLFGVAAGLGVGLIVCFMVRKRQR